MQRAASAPMHVTPRIRFKGVSVSVAPPEQGTGTMRGRAVSPVLSVSDSRTLRRAVPSTASKSKIEATLESFLRDSSPTSVFLTSYFPALHPNDDYQGDRWIGTSHESDTPGVVRHALPRITEQCQN